MMTFILKLVTYLNQPMAVACDARCSKAWGIQNRPRVRFDEDDDFAYFADNELGDAPADPGTYEGGYGKPLTPEERMNKWCVRECERCIHADMNEQFTYIGFGKRRYNQPWKHQTGEE